MLLPTRDEMEKVRLAMDLKKTTALLTATLLQKGRVTLTKKETLAVYREPQLHFEHNPDGGVSFWVTHKGLDAEAMKVTPEDEAKVTPIREGEV